MGASGFRRIRAGADFFHEPAERKAAGRLILSRQLGDMQYVGEYLLARGAEREREVRPCFFQQHIEGCRGGSVVTVPVQLLQDAEALHHFLQLSRERLGREPEGMKAPDSSSRSLPP